MSDEAAAAALEALRLRITRVFPEQIRHCLDQLSDSEVWWRPNEEANSVGNLILHLAGSLDHYLNRGLGGLEFTRDRTAEFAERRVISRTELRARFDAMVRNAEQTFASLSASRLSEPSPEPGMNRLVIEDLIGIAVHLAAHTGQVIWVTKMAHRGGLEDLWMRTHRSGGAWPPISA